MSASGQNNETKANQGTESTDATTPVMKAEYARQGEFHRNLNPEWSYYPIYLNKVEIIDTILHRYQCRNGKILDAGCGEGVLVEKYAKLGWDICGVDKNYSSAYVQEGSITEIPLADNSIETVMALDVLEHLQYQDQPKALKELIRVSKENGLFIFSCPNLAHFTSRLKLLFRGKLLRTASETHHCGDRPFIEYVNLFEKSGLKIIETHGIFPTIPPIYRFVMRYPAKSVQLLRYLRKIALPIGWHFQIIFVCQRQ